MTQKSDVEMIRAGYYIPKEFKERLEVDAHSQRRSASYVLTEILGSHYGALDSHKNPAGDESK